MSKKQVSKRARPILKKAKAKRERMKKKKPLNYNNPEAQSIEVYNEMMQNLAF